MGRWRELENIFFMVFAKTLADLKIMRTFAPAIERESVGRETIKIIGALVQLVRIHACHAWGHGFESRTHRFLRKGKSSVNIELQSFFYHSLLHTPSTSKDIFFSYISLWCRTNKGIMENITERLYITWDNNN